MSGLLKGSTRATLRRQTGTIYVKKANTTLRDVCVDRVVVQAPGFHAVNVLGVGLSGAKNNYAVFDFTHKDASGVLEDCEILPDHPSLWVTGVFGHDYTASRLKVHNVTDGFGVYDTKQKNSPVNVLIQNCYVYDLTYFTKDPNHSDRHTHNDCVQIQGGTKIRLLNNEFRALASKTAGEYAKDPYRPAVTGSAIAVTPNVSPVGWLHVEGNILDGGAQSVTLIPGKFKGVNLGSIINNTFGRSQALVKKGSTRARRPGVMHPTMSVTWRGNTYLGTGAEAKLTITKQV